jgi:hypothetical protein
LRVVRPVSPADYGEGMNDEQLKADGWAAGLDVWEQVGKAYVRYLGGDNVLANSQLWSLREAIRAEYAEEYGRLRLEQGWST